MTPRKAQASSGKLGHTRAQEPSPSFTRRRIPQEPVRFNETLMHSSFSVIFMSQTTSPVGERHRATHGTTLGRRPPHLSRDNHRRGLTTSLITLPKPAFLSSRVSTAASPARANVKKNVSFSCACDDLCSSQNRSKILPMCPNYRFATLCDRLSRFRTHSSCRCTR